MLLFTFDVAIFPLGDIGIWRSLGLNSIRISQPNRQTKNLQDNEMAEYYAGCATQSRA